MDMLNTQLINEYVDVLGKEVFMQTVSLYERQAELYLQQLAEAAQNAEYPLWQDRCHAMKSAAGNVGLKELHGLLSTLEYSDDASQQLQQHVEHLHRLHDQSLAQLTKLLA